MDQQASQDPQEVLASIGGSWGWALAFAIATLILGVVVMAWPKATLVAVALVFGLQLLIAGLFYIVGAFRHDQESSRTLLVLLGILSVLVGIYCVRHIHLTLAVLILLLGAYWVVHGLIQFIVAAGHKGLPARGWAMFTGALSVVAGIVVLVWPAESLTVLLFVMGIWLVIFGLLGIFAAFALRSLGRGGPAPA